MSGPSMMPLCQAASSVRSGVGWVLPVGMKSDPSGMDHRVVGTGGFM